MGKSKPVIPAPHTRIRHSKNAPTTRRRIIPTRRPRNLGPRQRQTRNRPRRLEHRHNTARKHADRHAMVRRNTIRTRRINMRPSQSRTQSKHAHTRRTMHTPRRPPHERRHTMDNRLHCGHQRQMGTNHRRRKIRCRRHNRKTPCYRSTPASHHHAHDHANHRRLQHARRLTTRKHNHTLERHAIAH